MAQTIGRYNNGTGIGLTASAAKTIIQLLAPTNQMVRFLELTLSFGKATGNYADGDTFKVRVMVQTTAGTMSAATEVHNDSGRNLTLQTAVTHTATVEPTNTNELWVLFGSLYRQNNFAKVFMPFPITVVEGTRVGIEVTATQDSTCYPAIVWEE